jgi:siroheme synthase-like protein
MDQQPGFYPIFLDLQGRKCVVVGGGRVAERKTAGLLEAGALVTIVSPSFTAGIRRLDDADDVSLVSREFKGADLEEAVLVFAATDSASVNRMVYDAASDLKIPVNVADRSVQGDFIIPSSFKKGPLQVAVSTGGGSPALARLVRQDLEQVMGEEVVELAQMLERLRPRVMIRFPADEAARRRVWERLVAPEVLELIQSKNWDRLEEIVAECLSSSSD